VTASPIQLGAQARVEAARVRQSGERITARLVPQTLQLDAGAERGA
jgi:hypothetical protein